MSEYPEVGDQPEIGDQPEVGDQLEVSDRPEVGELPEKNAKPEVGGQPAIMRPTVEQLQEIIARNERKAEARKAIKVAVGTLLVFAAIAVLSSTLLLPVYEVRQGSMAPTLLEGELIVFSTIGEIRRGDIIAFHFNNQVLIKRVIAMEGEWVDITEDGTVLVNNEPIDEPYLDSSYLGECDIELPYLVPLQRYFVMGDNRLTSLDSRFASIGTARKDMVAGKALLRVWPLMRVSLVK